MGITEEGPHFVLLPFLAPGHMIPLVDIAKLLAKRRVVVSILVTPENGKRFQKAVDRAIACGFSIRVFHLSLPCAEAGLPQGCENVDLLTSMNYALSLLNAAAMLREQVEDWLLQLCPTCFIADVCFPWATDLALKLRIPRVMFSGTSCFSMIFMGLMQNTDIMQGVASDREYFVVPDMPHVRWYALRKR